MDMNMYVSVHYIQIFSYVSEH